MSMSKTLSAVCGAVAFGFHCLTCERSTHQWESRLISHR